MSEKHTNQLASESSPYLLQHAHNPVNWHPWGKEALQKAKDENKPMIISIGYAACHWCHVMEHESFEDEAVADIMNKNFVCIKVDREERPDIDQVYMEAAQLITGRGGWPLNAFALPDQRPFYAGTYFPKEQWMDLLQQINNLWNESPEKLDEQANAVTDGLHKTGELQLKSKEKKFNEDTLNDAWEDWQTRIDYTRGGHNGAPKFPMPIDWEYLLAYHHLSGDQDARQAVKVTLDRMARGGIYDQVGGGFARYSVDPQWHVPHFEKMLYDNAQLVSLYTHAFQVFEEDLYERIVHETLAFIEREMTSREGGFYSSLDADSEGVEGKYYVWTAADFDKMFGEDAALLKEYFDVSEEGNWEGTNVLRIEKDNAYFLDKYDLNLKDFRSKIARAKEKLLIERNKRVRPALDDKILTSWNALMLKAYTDAYRVFDKKEYLQAALKNADFISNVMKQADGRLERNYKNGKSSINAFLDDYALTIEAFINLYQASFDEKWLHTTRELCDYALRNFYSEEKEMFFYTSKTDPRLVARKMELSDNVIPASNSVMANNLFYLGKLFDAQKYLDISEKMLTRVSGEFEKNPAYYAKWGQLMLSHVYPFHEIAIAGEDVLQKRIELDEHYLPNAILLGGKEEGQLPLLRDKLQKDKTMIYVCVDKACMMPVEGVEEALDQIKR